MDRFFSADKLIYMWIVGLVVAGIILFFFGEQAASFSSWGRSPGWQNEIAIWNLAMVLVLLGVVRSNKGNESAVIPGLVVLSLFFSINHIYAMYQSGAIYMTHLSATLANMGGVFLALIYYATRKIKKTTRMNNREDHVEQIVPMTRRPSQSCDKIPTEIKEISL